MARTTKTVDERILDYLDEARSGGLNPTNIPTSLDLISRDLGLDRDMVERHCNRLHARGIIERFEVGMVYYRLPIAAPQHA